MIGLLVAGFVNFFLQSGPLGWIISVIGVIVFTIFTAYDVQKITRGDYAAALGSAEKASVLAALHLYINFVAIFFYLLRILGGTRD
jgi:FtsH-binding integral membrane protein